MQHGMGPGKLSIREWARRATGTGIDTTVPTPPSPDEAVGAAEVRARLGRPSLSGTNGTGRSPKRQVRLPEDLDAALQARIDAEHGRRLAYCAPFLLTVRGEGAQ